jgi:O-antigen/teichoic acid export membrane protein
MQTQTRTKKATLNSFTITIFRILEIALKFVVRSFFIYYLSVEYLGLNGLYLSIISVLSLAELGFGMALPFSLYKPVDEKDYTKINAILKLYKKIYYIIALVVLILGLILIPFLGLISEDITNISSFRLIFLLFVLNSSISYLFVYKRSYIIASQQGYKASIIDSLQILLLTASQVLVLVFFQSYIIYLITGILFTIGKNLIINKVANTLLPIKNLDEKAILIHEEEKQIKSNVKVLFVYRMAMVVETAIDNLYLSTFFNLTTVGIYSNYYLIVVSIRNVLMAAFNSLIASIGNVALHSDADKSYKIYKSLNTIAHIIYGTIAITIYFSIDNFIIIWLGQDYLLDSLTITAICLGFYIFGVQSSNAIFRNSFGLFWEGRIRPYIMTIMNVIFSYVFLQYFGVSGIFFGTALSRVLSVGLMDSHMLHKYIFHQKVIFHHLHKFIRFIEVVLIIFILTIIKININIGFPIISWILNNGIIFLGSVIILIMSSFVTGDLRYLFKLVNKNFLSKRRKSNED